MHGQIQFLCLVSAVHFARKDFLLSATYSVQSQFTSYLLYETIYKFLDFSINSWICIWGYNNTKNWQEWKQLPPFVAKCSSPSLKPATKKCGCDENLFNLYQ